MMAMQDCIFCGDKAFLRCLQCSPAGVLCQACDKRLHEVSPFHDRRAWSGSHFEAIPPTVTIDDSLQAKTISMMLHMLLHSYAYTYSMLACVYTHQY